MIISEKTKKFDLNHNLHQKYPLLANENLKKIIREKPDYSGLL